MLDTAVPAIASRILQILHEFYFITSRIGPGAFSSYNFVYYAAIDLLTSCPTDVAKLILTIAPIQCKNSIPRHGGFWLTSALVGKIPALFADRLRDLYFLNLCEQVAPVLSPAIYESVLIPYLSAYLVSDLEVIHSHFEAAHSVMLVILASPQSAEIAATVMPFYVDSVFKAFPSCLSARQFRLAFRTLIGEASPPRPISTLHPNMADILLEILCEKIVVASPCALSGDMKENSVGLSEKDVCMLALIDALSRMRGRTMLRWLDPASKLLNGVQDVGSRQRITQRFWDVLSTELDISRAEIAVRWWGDVGRQYFLEARTA